MTISDSDLREILKVHKETHSGQYVCDCVFCGKEGHMYVNKNTQLFDCKKCGTSGNIFKLLRYLDKLYLLGGKTVDETNHISSIRNINDVNDEIKYVEEPKVKLPVGWKQLNNSNEYLMNRGITPKLCKRYHFGATTLMRKYSGYIIVPIYDNGVVRGFIGRYGAKMVPDNVLRYSNSEHTKFSKLLFGYDEITENTVTVILVEGIFDKIAVDKVLGLWNCEEVKCVATFGKKISDEQILKLELKGIQRVILLYDFDAVKDIKKYGLILQQHFITVITFTTKKDIDECTPEEALQVFEHLYSPSDFNTDVIGRIRK